MNVFFDFNRSGIRMVDGLLSEILIGIKTELLAHLKDYDSPEMNNGFILIRLFTKNDGLVFHFPDNEVVRILNRATADFDIEKIVKRYSSSFKN